MARLGIPTVESTRTVRAAVSGFGRQPGETLPDPLPRPDIPPPVTIRRGKPVSEYTQREKDDVLQRQLGPAFYRGTKPVPGGDIVYVPSPNDHMRYDEATGQWRSKDGWERGL